MLQLKKKVGIEKNNNKKAKEEEEHALEPIRNSCYISFNGSYSVDVHFTIHEYYRNDEIFFIHVPHVYLKRK